MSQETITVYGKLVRDRIPEIIERGGKVATVRVLTEQEMVPALFAKLAEESQELRDSTPEERLGELADLHEVLAALAAAFGFSQQQVVAAARDKRTARGGFTRRLWLDQVSQAGPSEA